MRTVYLDNNATTRPSLDTIQAVSDAMRTHWHNPSSVHRPGQDARHALELARASIAAMIGASPRRLTLTASGTESIHLAIRGVLGASAPLGKRTIVTTAAEHAAVRDLCEQLEPDGITVRLAPLLEGGVVDTDALGALIDETTALVSVQWANNETGAIQPVVQIGEICRDNGVPYHCDATQWVGKMPCNLAAQDAPSIGLLTFSAHKFHGPRGIGGLWTARGVGLRPIMPGSQELGRRAGTEDLPAIAGAAAAAEEVIAWLAKPSHRARIAGLRDRFESAVLDAIPDASVNRPADRAHRLWNTTNIAFPRLEAEALLMGFSERGLCASAGAACSSGSLDPSPVLLAMGVPPERAHGSVRFSMSRETTDDETDLAARIVAEVAGRMYERLP
ncbi:MAG: cysteine desulfurase family protein [Planctomycetota bacterium]